MAKKKKEFLSYSVRLPVELHGPLKAASERNDRSMAKEIVKRLRQSLEDAPDKHRTLEAAQ
jgi:hypothetical protein